MSDEKCLASVMIYDDGERKWKAAGKTQGLSSVCIYRHTQENTFRVIGRKDQDGEVVINCAVVPQLKYNRATATFHQWRDGNGTVYGLNFSTGHTAAAFAATMDAALDALRNPNSGYPTLRLPNIHHKIKLSPSVARSIKNNFPRQVQSLPGSRSNSPTRVDSLRLPHEKSVKKNISTEKKKHSMVSQKFYRREKEQLERQRLEKERQERERKENERLARERAESTEEDRIDKEIINLINAVQKTPGLFCLAITSLAPMTKIGKIYFVLLLIKLMYTITASHGGPPAPPAPPSGGGPPPPPPPPSGGGAPPPPPPPPPGGAAPPPAPSAAAASSSAPAAGSLAAQLQAAKLKKAS
uniref:WH1 domain-containing protein n=1 Tax=Ciona intestinalis TaxID=7719 RepID=H2XPU1_CIOIN